jgi:hypothetical protein
MADLHKYFSLYHGGSPNHNAKIRILTEPSIIQHHINKVGSIWYKFICIQYHNDEVCPYCEQGNKAKTLYAVKLIDLHNIQDGVKVWRFSKKILNLINEVSVTQRNNMYDTNSGYSLRLNVTPDEYGGRFSTVTSVTPIPGILSEFCNKEVIDEWLSDTSTCISHYRMYTYDTLQKTLDGYSPTKADRIVRHAKKFTAFSRPLKFTTGLTWDKLK